MTQKGNDTVQETIQVRGVEFASQLTIGGAKWLQKKMGKTIMLALEDLASTLSGDLSLSEEERSKSIDIEKASILPTALYISAHPKCDHRDAEAAVDSLSIAEMMEVMGRASVFEFEPKNARPAAQETATEVSTSPPSSTT